MDKEFSSLKFHSSIKKAPWYSSNLESWYSLFADSPTIGIKKNKIIFHKDDPLQYVYFIKKGRVRSSIFDDNGQEKTILIYSSGSIFGDDSAVEKMPYEFTVTANTSCILAYMEHNEFLQKVSNCPSLSMQLSLNLTGKITRLTHQIKEMALLKSDERVIAHLLKLSDIFGEDSERGIKITIPFTHQEMADLVATSRVSVAKIMSILNKEGVLERVDGHIYIKNREALLAWTSK